MKTIAQRIPLICSIIAASAFTVCAFTLHTNPTSRIPQEIIAFHQDDTLNSFPTIMVKDSTEKSIPLGMHDLIVDIRIVGNISVTTLDMVFFNENDRVLEGELYFPLAAGQTVSRFAMEVDGKLREGVVVEKKEARVAFENTVRRKIDPGLIEWSKGNNFKARVCPIPAKGTKRILVTYTQELSEYSGFLHYYMPMKFKDNLRNLRITANILKQDSEPVLQENGLQLFRFEKKGDGYFGQLHRQNIMANEPLSFAIPFQSQQKTQLEYGYDQSLYFYTTVHPKKEDRKRDLPKSVSLLWDVSTSATGRDLEKELQLLKNYMAQAGNPSVELITFSNEIHSKETLTDFKEIAQKIRALDYDGATQLGCINPEELKGREIILASDCLSNFGAADFPFKGKPVYIWNSNVVADHTNAQYIADRSRGQYIDLTRLSTEEALESMTHQQLRFLGVADNPDISVTTDRANSFTESFSLAGKTKTADTKIQLQFGYENEVTETITVELKKSMIADYEGLTELIWAQKRIAELDLRYDENKDEITRLGKKYGVVTRNTSLLVLDRVEDYVTYRITPPEEMRSAYNKQVAALDGQENEDNKAHLEKVVATFKERKDWWYKTFSVPAEQKNEQSVVSTDEASPMVAPDMETIDGEDSIRSNFQWVNPQLNSVVTSGATNLMTSLNVASGSYSFTATDVNGDNMSEPNAVSDKAKGEIELTNWDPKTPYLEKLKTVDKSLWYKTYLGMKKDYARQPSFYIDVADFFLKNGETKKALRILSNIAELELENPQLLRILAHRLEQLEYYELAISVFKEVKKLRPEEPQSYRDLGLVYAIIHEDQLAVDELWYVVNHNWDDRFADIESLVALEMNTVIANSEKPLDVSAIDRRLIFAMPVDMRVIINWDTDNCDIDLWVTDPRGEKCFYSNKLTAIGGRISNDFTQGYGPEEFIIKKAIPGNYTIEADYFGNHSQSITGATTIQVQMITNYGRKSQQTKSVTRRLESEKEVVKLATFSFGG